MKVFLSYGHDEYEPLAKKLKADLEKVGIHVWIDKEEIKGTSDWEIKIEEGISNSEWIVILMTNHSVRRPDGVCLDEVSYARFLNKKIAPIMIENVKPPLCIARIQWIDMQNFLNPNKNYLNENAYAEKKDELIKILKGLTKLNLENDSKSLNYYLNPLDNDVYTNSIKDKFVGRTELINLYDKWCKNDEKVLWLVGDAGIGKTAFIANLCQIREEIQAVHFCKYNNNERANSKRAIMSLAFYLSTQVPQYREELLKLNDLNELIDKDANRLFEYLFVEPLRKINSPSNSIILVIDALDEATIDGKNELAEIISQQFYKTPKWLKLLITSRKELLLERLLSNLNYVDFSNEKYKNNDDIGKYLEKNLSKYLPENTELKNKLISKIVNKSGGIFLYAVSICEEINKGNLTLMNIDSFPNGLTGIYFGYFDRIFNNTNYNYQIDLIPIMELLCATCEPLTKVLIERIIDIDEYKLNNIMELICEMFPVKNDKIEPIHKSLIDWLLDSRKSGKYSVSLKNGNNKLANYCLANEKDKYSIKYLCKHLIGAFRYNEATKILSTYKNVKSMIRVMGIDTALRYYLSCLNLLFNVSIEYAFEIYESEAFKIIFTEHRKFFYNSGLYFSLKESGFSEFLKEEEFDVDLEGLIGESYYFYITEDFDQTIILVNKILNSNNVINEIQKAELKILIGLCFRKKVEFDKAKKCFWDGIKETEKVNEYYYRSTSWINLGKIAYHELDWSKTLEYNIKGIEFLEKELTTLEKEDNILSTRLFIAEYHRLAAESLIWGKYSFEAKEHLQQASKIYDDVQTRDRYYIRFLYTSLFLKLLDKEYLSVFENSDYILIQAKSNYDKSQILFYKAIAMYKLGRIDDIYSVIESGYKYALKIGAWLEMEEFVILSKIVNSQKMLEHSQYYENNNTLIEWINYVEKFIK